jgi:hypothetical protein
VGTWKAKNQEIISEPCKFFIDSHVLIDVEIKEIRCRKRGCPFRIPWFHHNQAAQVITTNPPVQKFLNELTSGQYKAIVLECNTNEIHR